jgi:AraC-like DNA-binding protein
VASGKGILRTSGREYSIGKSDLFFLFPGIVHYYVTDPLDLLELWWIGFNGPNAQSLVENLSICHNNAVLNGITNLNVYETIKEIVKDSFEPSSGSALKTSGNLYKLFGQLMDICSPDSHLYSSENNCRCTKPVEKALSFIETNYPHNISISQIAAHAGLSRSHFSIRFKNEVGCSPSEHLTKMRLKQAKYYLLNSSLSITEIAHSAGFKDSLYFSRIFSQHEGLPPSEFRKNANNPTLKSSFFNENGGNDSADTTTNCKKSCV